MWIFTRPRSEHDMKFMLNLDQCSRIQLTQLGERWFVEVMLGTESVPVASAGSVEEAAELLALVFEAIRSGDNALDLSVSSGSQSSEEAPTRHPTNRPCYPERQHPGADHTATPRR